MNYTSEHLENKAFNFVREFLYNLALSVCIVLFVALLFVWLGGYKPYQVLSNSEAPYFVTGDMVISKKQKEYHEGDIITFVQGSRNVTHRLVAIKENPDTNELVYIAHGDNVQSGDGSYGKTYLEEIEYFRDLNYEEAIHKANIQCVSYQNITGKVVIVAGRYGAYFDAIKKNALLIIVLIGGIWCVNYTISNEIQMKKNRRLFA